MGEVLSIQKMNKNDRYADVVQEIDKLLRREPDMIANLANTAAILHSVFQFSWVGFYLRRDTDLVLGPFQGRPTIARISITPLPSGVCGHAASLCSTLVIDDVMAFPDYIDNMMDTRSEIAVPLVVRQQTELLLNVESKILAGFDETDQRGLENIMRLIGRRYFR